VTHVWELPNAGLNSCHGTSLQQFKNRLQVVIVLSGYSIGHLFKRLNSGVRLTAFADPSAPCSGRVEHLPSLDYAAHHAFTLRAIPAGFPCAPICAGCCLFFLCFTLYHWSLPVPACIASSLPCIASPRTRTACTRPACSRNQRTCRPSTGRT
jgi:hypothetical protein